ncbi:aldolase/citrate lyase family protein [Nocardioides sp. AN3]
MSELLVDQVLTGLLALAEDRLAAADAALMAAYPGPVRRRQPVHTCYVSADAFSSDITGIWGGMAASLLDEHGAPDALVRLTGLEPPVVGEATARLRVKLRRNPVEDVRIDFEDGYGAPPPEREDADATRAGADLAELLAEPGAPFVAGLRIRSLGPASRARALRTLVRFVGAYAGAGGTKPLTVTLPKVTSSDQVAVLADACTMLETTLDLPFGLFRIELQIETPQSVLAPGGRVMVPVLLRAGGQRVTGLHYGTYDYSASCGVAAAQQSLEHPVADFAKGFLQLAAADAGVLVSDGSSNVLPIGDRDAVHAAWRLHARLVRRSLDAGLYQGWDLHPGQLISRYLATYVFFREGLDTALSRLNAYAARSRGAVLDEPATARALAGFLLRGLECGALDEDEVLGPLQWDRSNLVAMARPAAARS